MKPLTLKSFIPGIAWFFLILILICIPGDEIPRPHGWFEWINLINFDKMVHSGLFAILTFLFIYPFAQAALLINDKRKYFFMVAVLAIAFGLVTELIQKFFIPTRSFDLIDWTADSIGVIIGYFFCRLQYLRKNTTQNI